MRIIAGIVKGFKIKAPSGINTRPTSERVREAMFSSLGEMTIGAIVLDLYAGSGALGIEALSRRAKKATFVDSSITAISTIKQNIAKTNFKDFSKILRMKVETFLATNKNQLYDLIFIDAPYKISLPKLENVIKFSRGMIAEKKGLIIVEHSRDIKLSNSLKVTKERIYGQTIVSYIGKEN